MPKSGLQGKLPSLAPLSKLVRIDLNDNKLKGALVLPTSCSLKYVLLNSNGFGGAIPSFNGCAGLLKADLGSNAWGFDHATIPDFSGCKLVQFIDISGSFMEGSIPSFSKNVALHSLLLSLNSLTGKIPSFTATTQLKTLDLQANDDLNCAAFAAGKEHPAGCDVECGYAAAP
jgi:hypothetical protein